MRSTNITLCVLRGIKDGFMTRFALSLEQWLQTTCIVTGTMASNNLHCHWNNGFKQLALSLEQWLQLENCVVTNGFKNTCCVKNLRYHGWQRLYEKKNLMSLVVQRRIQKEIVALTVQHVLTGERRIVVCHSVGTLTQFWTRGHVTKMFSNILKHAEVSGYNWISSAYCLQRDKLQRCDIYILHHLTQCKELPCRVLHNIA